MGNNKSENKSRRWFLTGGLTGKAKQEKVKMLTADGQLVEIDKAVLDAIKTSQKATNKEIYDWMNNPSKEKK
ncbi:MAG: hypothetical protein GC171_08555 [Terrimonas sp.]|nr:hypothetical protein [Terrimonas sp.]